MQLETRMTKSFAHYHHHNAIDIFLVIFILMIDFRLLCFLDGENLLAIVSSFFV